MAKSKRIIPKSVRIGVIKKCGPTCFWCSKEGFVSKKFDKDVVFEKETIKKWINEFDNTFHLINRPMEFDHIIPLFCGGKTTIENMVISCCACNRSKGRNVYGRR
ncbi:MAG: HNH endonuclease [Elusimicrobiota bacterium]